jgi:glycosyltransferase involved in cell wall biosynthesis
VRRDVARRSMRVSYVVLTYNRAALVERALAHNLEHAGAPISELIWVDNGSSDGVRDVVARYGPDVAVINRANLGVAKGWNRGYALATGDYIVLVDSDFLLPQDWLVTFKIYVTAIRHTGVACILHRDLRPDYVAASTRTLNGYPYIPCQPVGCRFLRRTLLINEIGYLREDFGLYGWEDVEWARRAVRTCRERGLITYGIPDQRAEHLGVETADDPTYFEFKRSQGGDPAKRALMHQVAEQGFPYYSPYA